MKCNSRPGDAELSLDRKRAPGGGEGPSVGDPNSSPLDFGLLESEEVPSQHKARLLGLGQHSGARTEIQVGNT